MAIPSFLIQFLLNGVGAASLLAMPQLDPMHRTNVHNHYVPVPWADNASGELRLTGCHCRLPTGCMQLPAHHVDVGEGGLELGRGAKAWSWRGR